MDEQTWLERQLTNSDAAFSLQGSISTRDSTSLATSISGGTAGGKTNKPAGTDASLDAKDALANSVLPSVTNAGLAKGVSSGISLTSIETLNDKIAYRNAIQARLREQELDDTHDLGGMALYTLKFDISVLPGEKNPAFGQVSLSFANADLMPTTNEFRGWIKSLNHQLLEECMSLERRYYMRYLSDEEKDQLFAMTIQSKGELIAKLREMYKHPPQFMEEGIKAYYSKSDKRLDKSDKESFGSLVDFFLDPTLAGADKVEKLLMRLQSDGISKDLPEAIAFVSDLLQKCRLWRWLEQLSLELNADSPGVNGALGLEGLIQERYQEALSGIVDITMNNQGVGVQSNLFFICTADGHANRTNNSTDQAFETFKNHLREMAETAKPRIAVVEPKEYAQNFSDVAAWDQALSLTASYNTPQASVNSKYQKHTQQMLDTIKRQPLLVGFANGDENFGWILGPKFAVENTWGPWSHPTVTWSHTPVQYSVEASVIVPGWWPHMSLVATNGWLDKTRGHKSVTDTGRFTVKLPQDYSAITRSLIARSGADRSLLQPSILPRWDSDRSRQRIVVTEGEKETVLIRGRDLWRNAKVYIGSQEAAEVKVMPDMSGLVATFDRVEYPSSVLLASDLPGIASTNGTWQVETNADLQLMQVRYNTADGKEVIQWVPVPGPLLVDLSVVTSGGMAVLRDGVQILPDLSPDCDKCADCLKDATKCTRHEWQGREKGRRRWFMNADPGHSHNPRGQNH
jgi:hypothetical protein